MNRSNGREIQLDRIRRARCFADYTQETMAEAMKPLLRKFSYKTYRAIETGTRAFRFEEFEVFMELTGATKEFLTGQSDTLELKRDTGLLRSSAVLTAA